MTPNELPLEKRIADELSIPESPPVHPEELLYADVLADDQKRPRTRLLLAGFDREELTADFLIGIHDLADDHDLPVESISVGRSA